MKTCSHCKQPKAYEAFSKNKGRADGYHHQCKECRQEYYKVNKVKIIQSMRQYYEEQREVILARVKQRYIDKREYLLKYHKLYREVNKDRVNAGVRAWSKHNHSRKIAHNNQRKADKINRTPTWLNIVSRVEIECIYAYATALNQIGLQYHVDHILPLKGYNVSGLHVSENLQVIPAVENMRKGNRYDQTT
jgi:hypothetical protein